MSNARFLALTAQHETAMWDIARNGGTPARYATIEAIEAEIDALAEAAEIAHYGPATHGYERFRASLAPAVSDTELV
jgi:hypothetical protein